MNRYSIIFKNIKSVWYLIIVVIGASLAYAYLRLLVPLYIGDAVNNLVGKNYIIILHFALLIFGVTVASSIFDFAIDYYANKASQKFVYNLRKNEFSHLLAKNYEYFNSNSTGNILSKFTMDIETLRRLVNMSLSNLFSVTFLIIIAGIDLTRLYYGFTVIFFVVIAPIIYFTLVMQRKQRKYWRALRDKYGTMNNLINQNIIGNRVVRSFTAEEEEIKRFNNSTDSYFDDYKGIAGVRSLYNPLLALFLSLAIGFVLIYGGIESIDSIISVGSVIAAVNIFTLVLRPVRFYGRYISFYENGMASLDRINAINNDNSDYKGTLLPEVYGRISLENLGYKSNNSTILTGINMDIAPGERVAIVGETGAGKTTLVNIISGLYKNYTGHAYLDGTELKEIDDKLIREKIGIVSQDAILFSGTIRYNITMGKDYTDDQVRNAAKLSMLDDFIDSLPSGYDTPVGERGITLSGGQKQRMAIARIIIRNPQIIIFDDSTSNLDADTETRFLNTIQGFIAGKTTIIISHKISSVMLAERAYVIEKGRVTEYGYIKDLIKSNGSFSDIFAGKFRGDAIE
ncbi:ABC transporter ATP-binding protein [Ferroplasma acidiphilum]|uniref:ABC transporter ATP-binding protein n=2 Tax=Ferroplasma acidiphilum TaxID=74969 RepID=A0A1V0N2G0_9ARCH|nr:ABC transporter ATP-binding protein [Ferroplasma acidiphilum]ARD84332.1 lipid exporter family ATPase and permease [Ferroplasma acidiphilum]NOL60193.1 ABC transporter ATP-binding protein [Ferroplasma acidiphilum]WMT53249.1 MAG: ABC transporter ATP-binding protein [Ferroplasma acidiphilum]